MLANRSDQIEDSNKTTTVFICVIRTVVEGKNRTGSRAMAADPLFYREVEVSPSQLV